MMLNFYSCFLVYLKHFIREKNIVNIKKKKKSDNPRSDLFFTLNERDLLESLKGWAQWIIDFIFEICFIEL